MKNHQPTAIIAAAMLGCLLSGLESSAASACGTRINLALIEQRIADPNLEGDLKDRAKVIKAKAAAAIEAGHRDEGRRTYYQLMNLLGIVSSSRFRCN